MISYAIPIVNGVINRRKLAFSLSLMGKNVTALIQNTWDNDNFRKLENAFSQIGPEIIHCAENQLAYPVLDYFYSHETEFSLGLQIVTMAEALSMLMASADETQLPCSYSLNQFREILFLYVSRCHEATDHVKAEVLPYPFIKSIS